VAAPIVTFLAPPSPGDGTERAPAPGTPSRPAAAAGRPGRREQTGGLRMTRGARGAATGMQVTDAEIRRCLDEPDDASPDPDTPTRTRFRRGPLSVVAAADGMVLRVDRRGR
jgi:hypothetical protein